jgi:hypothetical protein
MAFLDAKFASNKPKSKIEKKEKQKVSKTAEKCELKMDSIISKSIKEFNESKDC